jgi:probable O-glycosylation ligase (exosortase A-associated)
MRDLVALLFMMAVLPLALSNTFVAYLLWGWAGLISINSYLYGYMAAVPYVQVFALIALGRIIFIKDYEIKNIKNNGTAVLFLVILLDGFASAVFAYRGLDRNWDTFLNMLKTLLFCLLMPIFITTRWRLHVLIIVIAIGIGFHGIVDGLKYIASGGGHNAIGIAKFGDNNHFAMIMVMIIPVLLFLYKYSADRILRIGIASCVILVGFTVLATNSRGGLLSLSIVLILLILRSRRKFVGILTLAIVISLGSQLVPQRWFDRMDTIKSAEQDASFMGRVTAWKRASAIAIENPILGGGYYAGQAKQIFEEFRYKDGLLGFVETPNVNYPAASHSIYFQVLGDLGFVGLFLFLGCFISAFIANSKIKAMAKKSSLDLTWAIDLANALTASLIAYAVGGAALSAAYFELPYYLVMLIQILRIQLQEDLNKVNITRTSFIGKFS